MEKTENHIFKRSKYITNQSIGKILCRLKKAEHQRNGKVKLDSYYHPLSYLDDYIEYVSDLSSLKNAEFFYGYRRMLFIYQRSNFILQPTKEPYWCQNKAKLDNK